MCSGVNCFEWCTTHFTEQATGEEVAFTGHPPGCVGVQAVVLDTFEDSVGASSVHTGGMV